MKRNIRQDIEDRIAVADNKTDAVKLGIQLGMGEIRRRGGTGRVKESQRFQTMWSILFRIIGS